MDLLSFELARPELKNPNMLTEQIKIIESLYYTISREKYNHARGAELLALFHIYKTLQYYINIPVNYDPNEYVKSLNARLRRILWWNDKELSRLRELERQGATIGDILELEKDFLKRDGNIKVAADFLLDMEIRHMPGMRLGNYDDLDAWAKNVYKSTPLNALLTFRSSLDECSIQAVTADALLRRLSMCLHSEFWILPCERWILQTKGVDCIGLRQCKRDALGSGIARLRNEIYLRSESQWLTASSAQGKENVLVRLEVLCSKGIDNWINKNKSKWIAYGDQDNIKLAGNKCEDDVRRLILGTFDSQWTYISNLTGPSGEVDGILMGPDGLFVLEIKAINGDVLVEGEKWKRSPGTIIKNSRGESPSQQVIRAARGIRKLFGKICNEVSICTVVVIDCNSLSVATKPINIDCIETLRSWNPLMMTSRFANPISQHHLRLLREFIVGRSENSVTNMS